MGCEMRLPMGAIYFYCALRHHSSSLPQFLFVRHYYLSSFSIPHSSFPTIYFTMPLL